MKNITIKNEFDELYEGQQINIVNLINRLAENKYSDKVTDIVNKNIDNILELINEYEEQAQISKRLEAVINNNYGWELIFDECCKIMTKKQLTKLYQIMEQHDQDAERGFEYPEYCVQMGVATNWKYEDMIKVSYSEEE
tara:strand:- start:732 stop:1148 length:417 start_codon:yes stop_codon:yes gene_type:complete